MASLSLILIFILIIFSVSPPQTSLADDSSVMAKLASSLSPLPSDWKGTEYCTWTGIKCDATNLVISIDLSSSSISGSLPPDLNRLSQLQTLFFQKNRLSGPIPSLANLTSLREIHLDDNDFSSFPPDFFSGLCGLHIMGISNNMNLAPWSIPADLAHCGNLATFTASNASIIGLLPDIFSSFPSLQNLHLSYNNITGPLPPTFAGSYIVYLWLNNQIKGLSGNIDVLSSMTQLSQIWLQANQFTGPLPDLVNCTDIFDLQLRDNQLTGVIPKSVMNLPKLVNISLQNNKIQGPMPVFGSKVKVELGQTNSFCKDTPGPCDDQVTALLSVAGAIEYPMQLAQSWQGNDACSNWLSVNCDTEGHVTIVNFGKDRFSGTISPAFANLTFLRSLILNDNNLTGSIPMSLTTLPHLQILDVSNNNLSGPLPVFHSSVQVNSKGNAFLGMKINPDGTVSTSWNESAGIIAALVIAVVLFVAVVLYISYRSYVKKRKQEKFFGHFDPEKGRKMAKNVNNEGPNELQRGQSSRDHIEEVFSIETLRQVTNDFSNKNELGKGGFGIVYKGELQDGTKIAVKRMESSMMSSKGMNEFHAEIGVLKKVRHRHLVALLGYCMNGNERLLVFEYMPQGNLAQRLFDCRQHGYSPLTWKQRISIALDVARGVEYLHSLAQQSFIHRDLKPANILLGDDLRAKVADFGLVKNAHDGNYSMDTRLAGTFGYLAPEYANTGRVSTKIDVYAFGVILMEIITGRKSLDEKMPNEQANLVSWFRRILINKEEIRKVIDESLDINCQGSYESICKVAELSGYCTAREPLQRPDMGHIVNVLSPFVDLWKPCEEKEEDEKEGVDSIDLDMSLSQIVQKWKASEGTSSDMFSIDDSRSQSKDWR
ncbi:receptor-like kinase TMK4 [Impatiens glandulifera]|uniref:receptor-like kinase TMK4 n=1 Tax=Impatiens glandulifera TaxID=253017 RepID=UPI001FB0EA7B|nr:receptor-like kinase TMK4 [Impatiens glandulifera]